MRKVLFGGMLLVCLLCMSTTSMAAYDERLPDGVNGILSGSAWDSYVVTSVDSGTKWGQSGDVIAAVLSKGEKNILCLFTRASGEWKLVVKREKALYAGDRIPEMDYLDQIFNFYYDFGDQLEEYWFQPSGKNKEKWEMVQVRVWTYDAVTPNAEFVEIKPTGSGLSYCGYSYVTGKGSVETTEKTTVSGVIYTDLDEFNIYSFPKSLSKARQKLTQPPTLPVNTQRDALPEGKTGSFRKDEKYPVYSGPSETYYRAANGKASVSTNDWIQIFGCENDMVLIQYAISSEKSRFGYISAEAVRDQSQLEVLEPAYLPASVSKACGLTDDPLKTKGEVVLLKEGEGVRYLATFGSEWTYVETLTEPPMRGFMPSEAIVISE
ncbi:MAG: hypothetical protein Q4F18_02310 [Clostridia bacterium]|nr:hypothetical protein [Clostridia bacterium]